MITPDCIEKIKSAAKIEEVIADFVELRKNGSGLMGVCPKCQVQPKIKGKVKGFTISPAKALYKCFTCGFHGKFAIEFLMDIKSLTYVEALTYLSDKYHILLEFEEKTKGPQRKGSKVQETFCDRQLKASGLTQEDQKVWLSGDLEKKTEVDCFVPGTRDQYGKIDPAGDDLIIWYYDLLGHPVMFKKPKGNKQEHLFRIRWQCPDLHKDLQGKSMKYSSPYGSGSHLFLPEAIREAYRNRRVIKRLYLQEGEKKSIKACKHGLFSVGLMGINGIGIGGKLPYELELIVRTCKVEQVVFVLDSDWDHLSNDLQPGSKVDQRPYNFYHAVKNYKDYFKTFVNQGIYLEIYFGHIKENEWKEKGIDDLLAGSLSGKELDLFNDIETAINEKDGAGEYITLFKISTVSDLKLLELWSLQNADAFAKKYRDILIAIPEFKIGQHKWRFNDKGKLEPAQPLAEDEQYWEKISKTDKSGNTYCQFKFKYRKAYIFLRRRGFGRIEMANRQFLLSHTTGKVIDIVEPYQIRDYMTEFTEAIVERLDIDDVMDMLYRGGKMYFGPDSLSNIDYVKPVFEYADKSFQYLFFREKFWKIDAEGIEEHPMNELQNYVWSDKVMPFKAEKIDTPMVVIEKITEDWLKANNLPLEANETLIGQFNIELSEDAKNCHFLSFISHTGEFFWRKFQDPKTRQNLPKDSRSQEEQFETNLHFVSKMTAIGYLLHKYRDKSCEKAVIGMDGRLSEVGDSNGRTGKSLLGIALGHVIPQVYIGAKAKDLEGDIFIFEEVSEKTDNIFLDDVRANLDFEFFFPLITGRLTVNRKGQQKFTLADQDTPKMYLTTNHAINGSSSSFRDRQALIAFSDYYNDEFKPIDEFGINFFEEWGEVQYNLFFNFMATCLQVYFKAQKLGWGINHSGLVTPPTERLEMRRLRQFIGEDFLAWANEYYSIADDGAPIRISGGSFSSNLNCQVPRSELFNDFREKNPNSMKFMTPQKFKKKIVAFCKYHGLWFNPKSPTAENLPGGDDKSHGVEYFTIAVDESN